MDIKIGHVYPWRVVFIDKTHIIVKTIDEKYTGLLHISEISDYYVDSINSLFKMGEIYDLKVINLKDKKNIKLSWKQITPRFLKNPFEYNIIETKNGFKTLQEFVEGEIQND